MELCFTCNKYNIVIPLVMGSLTSSEARVLVFVSQVYKNLRNATEISKKLEIDYPYTTRILKKFEARGWVTKHKLEQKVFYHLTDSAPLEDAKEYLMINWSRSFKGM